MKARFFRLYPLHIFMFVFAFGYQLIKLFIIEVSGLNVNLGAMPFTGDFDVKEIIPNLLLIQSWLPFTEHLSYNGPSWSISIEFYMYALLFITVKASKKIRHFSWLFISFSVFILLYLKSTMLVEPVLKGLYCFFAFESGIISEYFKVKALQNVGGLSYSIYMIHVVFLWYFSAMLKAVQAFTGINLTTSINGVQYIDTGSPIINNIVLLSMIFIIIYLSMFTYKYVELKGQQIGR